MIRYSVWLSLVLGAANSRVNKIFDTFITAENVYKAGLDGCRKSLLFTRAELLRMEKIGIEKADEIIDICKAENIRVIPYKAQGYPFCLSVIEDPPIVLYVKGNMPNFDKQPSICIVGPRKVSEFGKKSAFSLGFRLAASGMIIVSGGALGADSFAHMGALRGDGVSVAVLGCGIRYPYLSENEALRQSLCDKGCLISEYPPDEKCTKFTFPARNRIMSALSLGTVVVEAGAKSGALITARHANNQGRDIFVIPGSPVKKEYEGSNALLRDGAKPLLDASDIFNEYIHRFPDKINIEKAYQMSISNNKKVKEEKNLQKSQKNLNETLSKNAKIVYNQLDKQKFFPDEILNTGLSATEMLSALTELEMEFLIKAIPGGMYEKL